MSALLANWFTGRELAFAFGLNLSIARLGSVINNIVSPLLCSSRGIVFAIWFGVILCGFIIFCAVFLIVPIDQTLDTIIDKSKLLKFQTEQEALLAEQIIIESNMSRNSNEIRRVGSKDLPKDGDGGGIVNPISTNHSTTGKYTLVTTNNMENSKDEKEKGEIIINFNDLKKFPTVFWLLVLMIILVYGMYVIYTGH